jgi:hypothetical protein
MVRNRKNSEVSAKSDLSRHSKRIRKKEKSFKTSTQITAQTTKEADS